MARLASSTRRIPLLAILRGVLIAVVIAMILMALFGLWRGWFRPLPWRTVVWIAIVVGAGGVARVFFGKAAEESMVALIGMGLSVAALGDLDPRSCCA